jgi:hypothetical protein
VPEFQLFRIAHRSLNVVADAQLLNPTAPANHKINIVLML